ncbi:uncharacterized protein SPPG_04033 [Spizellomyces punctatus DAOM BR117]|uniref:MINDY deubiquitinase domain-containing protein n=1 Tax=Spizellomyces punctatus (strain DAOM BR117) TaxID=645134 RepID=A0A0L0HHJ2_SPIPD|nr:uncharacterized protein SPPG_04033 [Spizellomyces punctatus DAOM BR117]KND00931.1 hypothetical protein SPPG_04033 [Spizellomyces punctatus DAOM BR117]|eukprot:XP_016608970.1 hypothetical protein SPPG_04033 [Spizellomyces punctatus DAOM BR117]
MSEQQQQQQLTAAADDDDPYSYEIHDGPEQKSPSSRAGSDAKASDTTVEHEQPQDINLSSTAAGEIERTVSSPPSDVAAINDKDVQAPPVEPTANTTQAANANDSIVPEKHVGLLEERQAPAERAQESLSQEEPGVSSLHEATLLNVSKLESVPSQSQSLPTELLASTPTTSHHPEITDSTKEVETRSHTATSQSIENTAENTGNAPTVADGTSQEQHEPQRPPVGPRRSSLPSPSPHPPPQSDLPAQQSADKSYRLKPITYLDPRTDTPRRLKIITQNRNGPCPLLALCNVLLLRGDIEIRYERDEVDYEYIVELIGDWLTTRLPLSSPNASSPTSPSFSSVRHTSADFSKNFTDVLEIIPTLQTGLDVNVRFDSPFSFEVTSSLLVFDLFKIILCHGWTVDPQDEETYRVVVSECGSYNQVVEKVIEGEIAAAHQAKGKEKMVTEEEYEEASRKRDQLIHEGLVCKGFLDATASQLTYHGLQTLCETLEPNSLAVLFRNNHFCTLFKRVGKDGTIALYTLVTDQGFVGAEAVVWETMDNVEGDSSFVDGCFNRFETSGESEHIPSANLSGGQQPSMIGLEDYVDVGGQGREATQASSDLALALSLQEEENVRHDAYVRRQQEAEYASHSHGRAGQGDTSRRSSGSAKGDKKKDKCLVM